MKIIFRKKIYLRNLFLIIFFFFLFLPSFTFSRTTSNCCQIRSSFHFNGKDWFSGYCYGEVGGTDTVCVAPGGKTLCKETTGNYEPGKGTIERVDWGVGCILNTVYRITDLIFMILIIIAIVVSLAGAYNILTAGGDAEKLNKGRDLILYAILGTVVAFFARAIPSIVAMVI